ncbi:hypothetical protein B0H19DRAFT_1111427 [Mycena capillaripes]|nr:hypothetical protein B0H19DRAFT_1111427 [Mycena capillaripes]
MSLTTPGTASSNHARVAHTGCSARSQGVYLHIHTCQFVVEASGALGCGEGLAGYVRCGGGCGWSL